MDAVRVTDAAPPEAPEVQLPPLESVPAPMTNRPCRFGVPAVPSQICQPVGICVVFPAHSMTEPTGTVPFPVTENALTVLFGIERSTEELNVPPVMEAPAVKVSLAVNEFPAICKAVLASMAYGEVTRRRRGEIVVAELPVPLINTDNST